MPVPLADPVVGALRTIEGRAPRVLILGDSIGDQHGSHAAFALREAGVDVEVVARWGGSLFTTDQYDYGATLSNPSPESLMARATEAVVDFNPDLVAVYINHNYWPPFPHDAAGDRIVQGSPEFLAMAQTQLRALMPRLTQNRARVYLVEPFPYGNIPAASNTIWNAYLALQPELGFGVIRAGQVLSTPEGQSFSELVDCAGNPASVEAADGHLSYFGAGIMGTVTARALAETLGVSLAGTTGPAEPPVALLPAGVGYRVVTCDGATFRFTPTVPSFGGIALGGGRAEGDPVVGATTTSFGRQGWLITRGGTVFPLGGTPHFGNAILSPGTGEEAVGIAAAPLARGYWVATSAGVVQGFGDVEVLGDLAGQGETVVAMTSTPDRRGYWLLTASGRVEAFGSALPFGDLRDTLLASPVVGLAAHPSGQGYWLLDRAGNVHPFGVAQDLGSAANIDFVRVLAFRTRDDWDGEAVPSSTMPTYAIALLSTVSGGGYWIALANGAVCHFGDAPALGGLYLNEVEPMQTFLKWPLYGDGPCKHGPDEDDDGGDHDWRGVRLPRPLGLLG
jgi:hypothetical protein